MFIGLTTTQSGQRFAANTQAISCVFESTYTPIHSTQKMKCCNVYFVGEEKPIEVTDMYNDLSQILFDNNN